MHSLLIKIVAGFLASIFALFNISADIPGFSDDKVTETTVQFLNEEAGSADAVITITTTTDGEYKLFWADENADKLTYSLGNTEIEYSEFAVIETYFG